MTSSSPTSRARWLTGPIRAYRRVSATTAPRCRYWPTCSAYAEEAIEMHGALRGTYLGVRRLLRCNPFGDHGVDPVPTEFSLRRVYLELPSTPDPTGP